jgi:hypothetical protein
LMRSTFFIQNPLESGHRHRLKSHSSFFLVFDQPLWNMYDVNTRLLF